MIIEINPNTNNNNENCLSSIAIDLEKVAYMQLGVYNNNPEDNQLFIYFQETQQEQKEDSLTLGSYYYNFKDIKYIYETWFKSKQPTTVEDLSFEVSKEVGELEIDPQYLSEVFAEYKEYDNLEHDLISCEDAIELIISQFEVLKGVKDGPTD